MGEVPFVSTLNVPSPPRNSTLAERRRLALRLTDDRPTIQQLTRHAEKFGVEAVVQTAIELGYGFDTVVDLQDAVNRVENTQFHKDHPGVNRNLKFPNVEKTVKAAMELTDEDEEVTA
jgi:hypothetical protein